MRTAEAVAGMLCPVCRVSLAMSDRQGVEIDYCPQCRGVWLDRGELDKIIERSAAADTPPAAVPATAPPAAPQPWGGGMGGGGMGAPDRGGGRDHHPDRHHDPRYMGKKRRKSFLEELFD